MPRAFIRPAWYCRALPMLQMLQLVYSSHHSSLYLTRVLLARTIFTADDAACTNSERLRSLLDPGSSCRHELPLDTIACAVSERLGPLLDPDSLAGTNYPAGATACTVSDRLGFLLDRGSLAGTNCPADITACAVSEHLGPLLDPGSLTGTNCPADATTCVEMTRPTIMVQVQQSCNS